MSVSRLIIFYFALLTGLGACESPKEQPGPELISKTDTDGIRFTPEQGYVNTFVKITGSGFGDKRENVKVRFNNVAAVVKEITDKTILTVVPVTGTTGKITVTVNGLTLTSITSFTVLSKNLSSFTGSWERKADFPGKKRSGVSTFANATSGFVTVGANGDFTEKDTWQYHAATNQWVQQTDFPGIQRFGAVSFTIGKKAYVVTGFAYYGGKINDCWEFDTETFAWTKKADFPGKNRQEAVGFAFNNKGYVTTGYTDYFEPELRDMWEYDPVADKWEQKANIPFASRKGAAGFGIGNKGYVGLGSHINDGSEEGLNDFWEYEPTTDTWTRKADFPEYITLAYTSFVLNQSGYLINGNKECWQYSPATDKWLEKKDLPTTSGGIVSFVIQDKAYVLDPYAGHLYQFEP